MEPQEVIAIARAHAGTLEATHNATGINIIVLRQALKLLKNGVPALVCRYEAGLISLRLAYKIAGLKQDDQKKIMDIDAKTFRLVVGHLGFLKDCEGIKRHKRIMKQLLS
jgi:hypothetical protein